MLDLRLSSPFEIHTSCSCLSNTCPGQCALMSLEKGRGEDTNVGLLRMHHTRRGTVSRVEAAGGQRTGRRLIEGCLSESASLVAKTACLRVL